MHHLNQKSWGFPGDFKIRKFGDHPSQVAEFRWRYRAPKTTISTISWLVRLGSERFFGGGVIGLQYVAIWGAVLCCSEDPNNRGLFELFFVFFRLEKPANLGLSPFWLGELGELGCFNGFSSILGFEAT